MAIGPRGRPRRRGSRRRWPIRCARGSCSVSASVSRARRSRHRARCPARRRLLPRPDAARLRLRRAGPHGARRGALQHFYKATARPNLDDTQWRTLPSGLRARARRRDVQGLVSDLAAAANAGTLEDPKIVLSARRSSSTSGASRSSTSCWPRRTSRRWRSPPRARSVATTGAEVFATELALFHFKRNQ